MAVARVVMFEGVSSDRMDEVKRRMSEGEPPEGMPSSELIVLHDPGTEKSLVVGLFDNEDDYRTRRRDPERDARGRHPRVAHVGHEVRRRAPHEELTSSASCATCPDPRPSRRPSGPTRDPAAPA